MIVALPCLQFSSRERAIIKQVNKCILTFPEFHDNYYVRYKRFKETNWRKLFLKSIMRHREYLKFVVYPDHQFDLVWLLKSFDDVQWIYPLHHREEAEFVLAKDFEWVGMPHRKKWRDYTLEWFLDFTKEHGLKRWYLGWWNETRWYILQYFNGFDTTLPEHYAYNSAKIWLGPHRTIKAENMKSIEIFTANIENFSRWVAKHLGEIECP